MTAEEKQKIRQITEQHMALKLNKIHTVELNYMYNLLCRARREPDFESELRQYEDGTDLIHQIETYFQMYNNFHGLDITESLTEFTDPRFADGLYFVGRTFDESGAERLPMEFRSGEKIVFEVRLYSHHSGECVRVPQIRWEAVPDETGLQPVEGLAFDTDTVTFTVVLPVPGFVKVKAWAQDENGQLINGGEAFVGGAGADVFQVRPKCVRPNDFGTFWRGQLKRLYACDPVSVEAEPYSGRVLSAFQVTESNHFRIHKVTAEDLQLRREKEITLLGDEILQDYDVYDLSLKAPGPCPSTMVLSIPKNAAPLSCTASFTYDGYSAHSPEIILSKDLEFHVTHHGYPVDLSDAECYNELNGSGILGAYGFANGRPNSDYTDPADCYILYMFLRDLQALRFMADPSLSCAIPGLTERWNGKMKVQGGSMGGYQTLGLCAMPKYLPEGVPALHIVQGTPNIPAFCGLGDSVNGRRFQMRQREYEPNMEYFDAAHFALDIACRIEIPRCGLGDDICPISGMFGMFNRMSGPKQITVYQNSGHGYIPEEAVQITETFRFD